MEPTKFENHISHELKNREIAPSAAAWDRLDAMLTIAEKPKPKQSRKWMFIAASFVGIALVATVFLQSQKATQNAVKTPEIVNTNSLIKDTTNTAVATIETQPESKVSQNQSSNNKNQKTIKSINAINSNPGFNSSIKSNQEITEKSVLKNEVIANQNQVEKPNETIMIANKPISTPKYVNPSALLAEAEDKSNKQKTDIQLPKGRYNIDAKSLLSQVDGELELSFRQRVIQKVSKTYQQAKVAVSERNNN
jgi:hypothetical protein